MSRVFTQKQISDYLALNPYNIPIHVGDLDNMNGRDYIFLDYLNDIMVASDNSGCYKTSIQVSVYTKEFAKRKTLVDYIKGLTQFEISFQGSDEGNYFVAILRTEIFLK